MNCKYCKKEITLSQVYNFLGGEYWHLECDENTLLVLEDEINKPSHYHKGGIDVIGFSEKQFPKEELKGFYRINILKYVTRYDRKNGKKDLKKAEVYLKKLIELEEAREKAQV